MIQEQSYAYGELENSSFGSTTTPDFITRANVKLREVQMNNAYRPIENNDDGTQTEHAWKNPNVVVSTATKCGKNIADVKHVLLITDDIKNCEGCH